MCAFLICSSIHSQVFGEIVYGWDFSTGLPTGWTSTSASGIGLWEYRGPNTNPSNATGPRGTCSGGALPIASQSTANGFMIFDSNYWDDNVPPCGGLGTGVDPAPHTAWLTSNVLDFTGWSTLSITFQEQFRLYSATCKVQVSVNNGPWTDAGTNSGLNSNNPVWTTYNLSTLAANQSGVRIRFQFSGTYYWWQIDDIYIYSPNDNDLMITQSSYTVNPTPDNLYNELEYDQYPSILLPPLRFQSTVRNIGGITQTGVTMTSRVLNGSGTQVHSQTTPAQNLSSGQSVTFVSPNTYTPAATLGDYTVEISVAQTQTDENPVDNIVFHDYTISSYTYARDEGPAENFFIPATLYETEPMEIGNVFEGFQAGRKCTSITVALGEGTEVGSQIEAIVYNEQYDAVLGSSLPYTINLADINTIGEEKVVTLQLQEPLMMYADSFYVAMVRNIDGSKPLRVCRSGNAPASTSFVKYYELEALFYLLSTPVVRMNIFLNSQVPGCTDPTAMNYVPAATVSDGSCRYPGCTIEYASNYNPAANYFDGSCIVPGCMDPGAFNYNPLATVDDGSCVSGGCTNPEAINYDPGATEDDGSCIIPGCTHPNATNYNPEATEDDGSCIVPGCMDQAAVNYDPLATEDNGSCLFAGCTNPLAINYDPNANLDNGTCVIPGCTDPAAANYNETANQDDGSCEYAGCTNPLAQNYDPDATVDDGSCIIPGCTTENAINYNPDATEDDGTCIIPGCTDADADNYNPEATEDDGSCQYLGCTDPEAANYDPTALEDDGSCEYPGCTDPAAINYNTTANVDDGSCRYADPVFLLNALTGCAPLTITVTNMTAISGAETCAFYINDDLIHSGCEESFTVTIENPGEYTIEYRLTSGEDVVSSFSPAITVSETPAIPSIQLNTGNESVECINCNAGDTFAWQIDGNNISEISSSVSIRNNGIIDNGFYQLQVSGINGCSAVSEPVLVLLPTIEFIQTDFCAPTTVEVINTTDMLQGAVLILDPGIGNNVVLEQGSSLFGYINPDTYEIVITLSWNGNISEISYTVEAGSTLIPVIESDGGFISCTNCAGNGTETWTINDELQKGSGPWPAISNGVYVVSLTTSLGCEASSSFIVNHVENFQPGSMRAYPNPAADYVRLESSEKMEEIVLFDSVGKEVWRKSGLASTSMELSLHAFSSGLYTLSIRSEANSHTVKLMIQR